LTVYPNSGDGRFARAISYRERGRSSPITGSPRSVFSAPTKFNINKIIDAMAASLGGYKPVKVDLDLSAKRYGDPFKEKGSAPDIEYGENLRNPRGS